MNSYNKNSPESIRAMFNSIAKNYDRTNAILSFQLHKRWNAALIRSVVASTQPDVLLDLCCGTGAIALDYLRQTPIPTKTYMLDFSEGMLAHAKWQAERMKLERHEISYLHADAQHIPLPNSSVACTTLAYGIRNVKQPQKCIEEVYRVLKPGGHFGILELTQPTNSVLRLGHSFYLRFGLPVLGKLLTSNQDAYQYLCRSIHNFIPPEELKSLMQAAGFQQVQQTSLFGGVATILSAQKKN